MAKLKIGREFFDITEKYVVLFNGACWQLTSQTIFRGWHSHYPSMSKTMCERFVKKGILVLYQKKDEYITSKGKQMGLYYYKFDMDKLNEYLNKE